VPNLLGRLESINTSRGGVPKSPVFETFITESGIDGDRQRDLRVHGGPDRAVVLYSLEVIRALQRDGHPITIGGAGENLTVAGLEWTAVAPGAVIAIGDVRLLVTKYAGPCEKIAHNFLGDDFTRIAHQRHPGWSRLCARVTAGGLVRVGDVVEVMAVLGGGPNSPDA
jgi:MOSC domain-containing protein YiiM